MNCNLGSCPVCHQDLSDITDEEYGSPPVSNGDLAVCCMCGSILEVIDGGKCGAVTVRDLAERGEPPEVLLVIVSVQAAVKRRNRARQAREN